MAGEDFFADQRARRLARAAEITEPCTICDGTALAHQENLESDEPKMHTYSTAPVV